MSTMDPIAAFLTKFRSELLSIPAVTTCIAENLFTGVAPGTIDGTYAIVNLVPLGDKFGQARTSIQTQLLADLKFISAIPVDPLIPAAILAAREHFRESLTYDEDGYRISIRHERPIEFTERGATADDVRIHRGSTYKAWISGTGD